MAVWEPEDIIKCKYTVLLGARCTALSTEEVQPVNFSGLEIQAIIAFSESRCDEQQQKKNIQEFRKQQVCLWVDSVLFPALVTCCKPCIPFHDSL